ncbi:hypothetical protein CGLO_13859 [Colletotrichum gloeosporioides Cg-14]|nr:hypothetical protein CGLO_13859 [Colletotrichum gloeosporioides Cg-14]
MADTKM